MRLTHIAAAGFAAALLASCGGGDDENPVDPGPDTSLPTLTVTLSEATETVRIEEGGAATFGFDASYTGTSTQPVIPNVVVNARRYELPAQPTGSGPNYTVNLQTVPYPAGGFTSSNILFQLCADAECKKIYPGSQQVYTIYLDVALKDWETQQRLSDHRGHVDAIYKKADFAKRWEYTAAEGSTLGAAAARRGDVVLTERDKDGKFWALGINSSAASMRWRTDLGTAVTSDPGLRGDFAYYTQTAASGTQTPIAIALDTGARTNLAAYNAPAGDMNQPVPFLQGLHLMAGTSGTVAHAYDLTNGTIGWQQEVGGTIARGAALGVDANYVYAFTGPSINLYSRTGGAPAGTIVNADFAGGTRWDSAPVLDGAGRLFAFTRSHAFAEASPLAGFAVASGARLWLSSEQYTTAVALGQQYLFAVNSGARRIDAIVPATGAIAYSIAIPGTGALTGNIVSTRSHVFVSTASDSYGFDIVGAAHAQDWTAAVGGKLALTPDNLLIITSGRKATAYKLH